MPRRPMPRAASQPNPSRLRAGARKGTSRQRRWLPPWAWVLVVAGGLGLIYLLRTVDLGDVDRLRVRAEAASQAGEWSRALELWRRINAGPAATGATNLGEGRACLAQGLAAQAERALRRAATALPSELEVRLLLLQILRVEDRPLEAFRLGWDAFNAIVPEDRPELLRELTLAALTDLPDNLARETLERWFKADTNDIDARVAYLRRIGAEPRADDPERAVRLAELSELMASHPDHVGVREALVTALADAGEPDREQTLLEDWPVGERDGRYWRLLGRWNLEHGHQPAEAITAFRRAIEDFPQDWRTHSRLARALQIEKRTAEARQEAETVARIRELLDPLTLGPKLDTALAHLDDPAMLGSLAELCDRAGLTRLASAWRALRSAPTNFKTLGRLTLPQDNEPSGRATSVLFFSLGSHPANRPLVIGEPLPGKYPIPSPGRSSRCRT